MTDRVQNIKQVAHHEAGHAVAGYELHVPVRYVTISRSPPPSMLPKGHPTNSA